MADRIKGITIEIDGDTTKLSKALKDANTELRQSQNTLKDVDKLLKLDPGNTTLLQQKFEAIGKSIDATKTKLQTLNDAAEQMKFSGKDSGAEWDALQREIAETEQDLRELNREMDNFGSVQAQKVAAAGEKVKSVGQGIESAGEALLPVTAAFTAVGAAGVASFAEVDKTMQLTNKTMGNTEDQAELLNKAMKSAAANSTYGMKDAATATLNFARAGLNAEQAAAALAPAMNLAAGEGGNLDTVSAGLVATINGFHGSFEDAGTYADVFAAACNNSALDVDSLSHAMSVAAPIFSSAGYSVNDAALYMGVMANNGIDADKAANSLKTGLARLVSPAKEGAAMMDKLGISVTNSDGTMKSSIQIQKELHDAFGKLSESEQIAAASAIFGKNQMAPWLALINTAPEDVGKLNESLETCAGTTDEMAEAMMSGFGGSLEKLKSSIDVLVTSVGEALAPTIQAVAGFIQGLVDKFNALTPAQQQTIVKIGAIVAAMGPLLIIIGKLTIGVGQIMTYAPKIVTGITKIKGVIGTLGTGLKALWGVLAANPIALVIAAVAALVAGFIYLWNTSEDFRNFWIGLWEKLKDVCSKAIEAIKGFFSKIVDFVKNNWQGLLLLIVNPFAGAFKLLYDNCDKFREFVDKFLAKLKELISKAWEAIKTKVSSVMTGIKDTVSKAWEALKTTVSKTVNSIKDTVGKGWDNMKSTVSKAVNAIKDTVSKGWNAIKTTVGNVLGAIKTNVGNAWSAVKSKTSSALSGVKSVSSSAWGGIKTTFDNGTKAVYDRVYNRFNSIKAAVSGALTSVKNTVNGVWTWIVNTVGGAVNRLRSLMNFNWSLPRIKLPHFTISGHFSLNPPSVPHFSIEWYKKAMGEGMILNSPTIFGAAGGKLLGGGEAGPEAVVGVDSLRGMIQNAVAGETETIARAMVRALSSMSLNAYIGSDRLGTAIIKAQQHNSLISGK